MELTDEDITQIEKSVREETTVFVEKKMKINFKSDEYLHHENQLVDYFGDSYASNPYNFRFEIGDIKIIKLIRDHIKNQNEMYGKKYLRRFREKKVRKSKQKIAYNAMNVNGSIEKNYVLSGDVKSDLHSMDSQYLSMQLVGRLKVYLQKFQIEESITEQINLKMVNVKVTDGGIVAEVFCILCKISNVPKKKLRPKKVYYQNDGKGSKYWVLSNLGQHIKKSHGSDAKSIKHEPDVHFDVKNGSGSDEHEVTTKELSIDVIEYVDVPVENYVAPNIETKEEKKLFDQISNQIGKMFETAISHGDVFNEMSFKLLDDKFHKLKVVKMPGDGSCLFHSITHQLFNFKASSTEHKTASAKLREDVCKYITMHYSTFKLQLQSRVYETVIEDHIKDMNSECLFILNECLPDSSFEGGMETILAVYEMYKVNILIFNEDGSCNFPTGFNEKHDRTLILAYRLNLNRTNQYEDLRNHYDSVSDISSHEIWNSFEFLSKILKNRDDVLDETL